jgi:N-hydroxyarylamine O-acetyltransferase
MSALQSYLARVRYDGPLRVDLETLQGLHLAHATSVPFENLDVQMGRPISLQPDALHEKIVGRRRGGYCFEQNSLFLEMLRAIGFRAQAYEGRVRLGSVGVRPRTHMSLGVQLGDAEWLADVGFGMQGLLSPLRMEGGESTQAGSAYRVVSEGAERVVQWRPGPDWQDLYAFLPSPAHPVDFVMGNHFTSTYPDSPFVQTLVVQLPTPAARYSLRNRTFTITTSGVVTHEETIDDAALLPLLRERFGLVLPEGTTFRALAAP